jgi:2-methylcitrate dehydratase PrpD
VLLHGDPLPQHFAPDTLQLPELARLRAQVTLRGNAELDAAFPAHYGAYVRVRLHNGECREARCRDAFGDPECPMTEADVVAKAKSLAEWGGHPRDAAAALCAAALALAEDGSLERYASALAHFSGGDSA